MGKILNELSNYQNVPRSLVFDSSISDRARFVYIFMASKPDDWDFLLEPMSKEIGYSVDTLRKYINELVESGWLVRGEQKNDKGKFGSVEYIIKAKKETPYRKNTDTENFRHGKKPTLTNIDNNIKEIITEENERDKSLSKENFSEDIFGDSSSNVNDNVEQEKTKKKKQSDDFFEECWIAYRRKGSKKKSKEYWDKLTDEDKSVIMQHIKAYVQSRDLNYQKDFERYLRDKIFLTIVVSGKNVVFDPTRLNGESSKVYLPHEEIGFNWNEHENCYMYVGCWSGFIPDGYKDDDRPDGATVRLGNSQGTVIWSSEKKEWVLHK